MRFQHKCVYFRYNILFGFRGRFLLAQIGEASSSHVSQCHTRGRYFNLVEQENEECSALSPGNTVVLIIHKLDPPWASASYLYVHKAPPPLSMVRPIARVSIVSPTTAMLTAYVTPFLCCTPQENTFSRTSRVRLHRRCVVATLDCWATYSFHPCAIES